MSRFPLSQLVCLSGSQTSWSIAIGFRCWSHREFQKLCGTNPGPARTSKLGQVMEQNMESLIHPMWSIIDACSLGDRHAFAMKPIISVQSLHYQPISTIKTQFKYVYLLATSRNYHEQLSNIIGHQQKSPLIINHNQLAPIIIETVTVFQHRQAQFCSEKPSTTIKRCRSSSPTIVNYTKSSSTTMGNHQLVYPSSIDIKHNKQSLTMVNHHKASLNTGPSITNLNHLKFTNHDASPHQPPSIISVFLHHYFPSSTIIHYSASIINC